MNRFLTPLAVATLALAPGLFAADLGRPARFGALEVASAESARSQAAIARINSGSAWVYFPSTSLREAKPFNAVA